MAIYDRINKPLTGAKGATQTELARIWPQVQSYIQTLSPKERDLLTNEAYGNVQIHRLRDLVQRKFGVTIPDGYHVKLDGTLHDNTSVGSFLAESALPAVAPFVAGAVLPALAGGASAGAGGATSGVAGAGSGVGTTAAAVVGGAAPVSKAYSWLSPLLRTVVPVAGQVIGGILQNNANKNADQIQQDALEKALAAEKEQQSYERGRDKEQTGYQRSQYANYLGRLDPYAAAGPPAVSRLTDVLGRPGAIPQVGNGAMITLRSPDGQTQQVPSEHADWYLSRGATRV